MTKYPNNHYNSEFEVTLKLQHFGFGGSILGIYWEQVQMLIADFVLNILDTVKMLLNVK